MKRRLSVNQKVISLSLGITLIGVIIGIVGLFATGNVSSYSRIIARNNFDPVVLSNKMSQEFLKIRINTAKIALFDETIRKVTIAEVNDSKKRIEDYINQYSSQNYIKVKGVDEVIKTERKLMEELRSILNRYINLVTGELYRAVNKGDQVEVIRLLTEDLQIEGGKAEDIVTKLIQSNIEDSKVNVRNAENGVESTIFLIVVILFVAIVVSIAASILISKGIVLPVVKNVSDIDKSTDQVRIATDQLSKTAESIASGATEQAASLEETTASMEELSSMVKQNTTNTNEASILSNKTSEASNIGYGQMTKMLEAMSEIKKSSDEIKNVIDVIDDIAFQTNMLALNAAVEAARAGEVGMGFAVVADEVKNLANRSAESAKETAKMIKASVEKAEFGLTTASELEHIFKEILSNANKLTGMLKEVEVASKQQDIGIGQINKALIQFDSVVQANASASEEMASLVGELSSQVGTVGLQLSELTFIITGKNEEEKSHTTQPIQAKTVRPVVKPKMLPKETTSHHQMGNQRISFESDEEFSNQDDFENL